MSEILDQVLETAKEIDSLTWKAARASDAASIYADSRQFGRAIETAKTIKHNQIKLKTFAEISRKYIEETQQKRRMDSSFGTPDIVQAMHPVRRLFD